MRSGLVTHDGMVVSANHVFPALTGASMTFMWPYLRMLGSVIRSEMNFEPFIGEPLSE